VKLISVLFGIQVLDDLINAPVYACVLQANRALRQASLGTLNALLTAYSNNISPSSYELIITELSSLIRYQLVSLTVYLCVVETIS
jgi:hypothetical protein